MSNTFITNTSTEGLAPLGSAPQRSFELISGTVLDELGERHAALFAEPEGTEFGDRFDWYASATGKPRRLDELEEEDQAAAKAVLKKLTGDIAKLGKTLLDAEETGNQRLGEALTNAVMYPGPEAVYVFGSGKDVQPVLVNWAWVTDTQVAATGSLTHVGGKTVAARESAAAQQAAVAAAAAPVPPPPMRRREGSGAALWWLLWLGWLLLMLMIGAILYLMIEACALKVPGFPNHCPPPGPTVLDLEREAQVLRDRIAAVERQVGIADRACQPKEASLAPRNRVALAFEGSRFSGANLKTETNKPLGRC